MAEGGGFGLAQAGGERLRTRTQSPATEWKRGADRWEGPTRTAKFDTAKEKRIAQKDKKLFKVHLSPEGNVFQPHSKLAGPARMMGDGAYQMVVTKKGGLYARPLIERQKDSYPALAGAQADDKVFTSPKGGYKAATNHAAFLAGEDIRTAGHLRVKKGKITGFNNNSGHYRPDDTVHEVAAQQLYKRGLLTEQTQMHFEGARISPSKPSPYRDRQGSALVAPSMEGEPDPREVGMLLAGATMQKGRARLAPQLQAPLEELDEEAGLPKVQAGKTHGAPSAVPQMQTLEDQLAPPPAQQRPFEALAELSAAGPGMRRQHGDQQAPPLLHPQAFDALEELSAQQRGGRGQQRGAQVPPRRQAVEPLAELSAQQRGSQGQQRGAQAVPRRTQQGAHQPLAELSTRRTVTQRRSITPPPE